MNNMNDLTTALIDIVAGLGKNDLRLIVGGGFGLYLRHRYLVPRDGRTLLKHWPEPRSTNDIDLFLRAELFVDSSLLEPLMKTLGRLNYQPVETAKYYQFVKQEGPLKVDLLTGTEEFLKGKGVMAKNRRAYPKPKILLHARTVNEAITLEEHLAPVTIAGLRSDGRKAEIRVSVPHPFTYIMLKLFALRDRLNDPEKDYGRHHALDIFTVVATMSEEEWSVSQKLRDVFSQDPRYREATDIVKTLFADRQSFGVVRIKESPYYREVFELDDFLSVLKELFLEML